MVKYKTFARANEKGCDATTQSSVRAFDDPAISQLAEAFESNRARLLALVRRALPVILLKRMDYEDVLQQAFAEAMKRRDYIVAEADVPVYFKLRKILLQTIADLERKHLQACSRDANREVALSEAGDDGEPTFDFPAEITSPVSRVDRRERHRILRAALRTLPEADRQILVLRHFDGYGNATCAEILGIEPKAASIRHVRALERLELKLKEVSCFRTT